MTASSFIGVVLRSNLDWTAGDISSPQRRTVKACLGAVRGFGALMSGMGGKRTLFSTPKEYAHTGR
jgi:hypothetical protein